MTIAASDALVRHGPRVLGWLDHAPQTNEVARAAVLIAAAHLLAARFRLPIVLSELGSSAGLNLNFDCYALRAGSVWLGPADAALILTPDWRGAAPESGPLDIAARAGVDLSPLDPVADVLRLRAYTWADQVERQSRLQAALDIAARYPPHVARGDAIDWLETRLIQQFSGHLHLIFHTIAWQYFPKSVQKRGELLIAAAGAQATAEAPLAHLSMEADGKSPGAGLQLTVYPGGETLHLGRADFHGRWINWQPRRETI